MALQVRLVAALLLATPASALAAPGIVTASVNLRAGPSVDFPAVDRIPAGVPVNVLGCIRQDLWCDVSWEGERGWVAAQYLDYLYGDRYVYLPTYVDVIDVPVASLCSRPIGAAITSAGPVINAMPGGTVAGPRRRVSRPRRRPLSPLPPRHASP